MREHVKYIKVRDLQISKVYIFFKPKLPKLERCFLCPFQ